jgi:hypothetical protein
MTLIEILNEVLSQSAFLTKGGFVNSTDVDDKQMVSIANRVAYEIMNGYTWSTLWKTFEITMTETENPYTGPGRIPDDWDETILDTLYDLPADFKSVIADSAWEQEGSRTVDLSTPARRWFMYKFSSFSDGGTLRARIMGDQIEVHDVQPGETFVFEYVSTSTIIIGESGKLGQLYGDRFTSDSNIWQLDDQLLILGIQAAWAETKMLPQAQQWKANYDSKFAEAIGRDVPAQTIGGARIGAYGDRRSPYYPLYRTTQ